MERTLTWVRAILSTTPARWQNLAVAVPETLLARKPTPAEWSARQCLLHLLDTERGVFPVRVRAFLAGRDFPAFDPDHEGSIDAGAPVASLAAELAGLRTENLTLLDTVQTGDVARTAHHPELGIVTLNQMLHEWAAHDLDHTIQAERAVMQPFILACGPWRGTFRAQDFGAEAP
jgi:hypothetical protein